MYIACLLYDISQITGVIPLSTLKSYYENKVPQGVIKHKTNEVKKLKGIFFICLILLSLSNQLSQPTFVRIPCVKKINKMFIPV